MIAQLSLFKMYDPEDLWMVSKRLVPLIKDRIKKVPNISIRELNRDLLFCLFAYYQITFYWKSYGGISGSRTALLAYVKVLSNEGGRMRASLALNRKWEYHIITRKNFKSKIKRMSIWGDEVWMKLL
jgi:hypothetical protein